MKVKPLCINCRYHSDLHPSGHYCELKEMVPTYFMELEGKPQCFKGPRGLKR